MEKKKISYIVKQEVSSKPILWKHIKDFQFDDNDIIEIGYVEPWENGPDNSGGGHYRFIVTRERLETDKEYNERLKSDEIWKEQNRKRRYESYLKLKEEFENEK